jgi:hypothetical protein
MPLFSYTYNDVAMHFCRGIVNILYLFYIELKNSINIHLWCGIAQLEERRLAVRQARVRFSAPHHREVFPLS